MNILISSCLQGLCSGRDSKAFTSLCNVEIAIMSSSIVAVLTPVTRILCVMNALYTCGLPGKTESPNCLPHFTKAEIGEKRNRAEPPCCSSEMVPAANPSM